MLAGPMMRMPLRRASVDERGDVDVGAVDGRDDDGAAHPRRDAVVDRPPASAAAGTAMMASQTSSSMSCTAAYGGRPPTVSWRRVDGEHRALAAAVTLRHSASPDRAGLVGRADDGDRARQQQAGDGAAVGAMLAALDRVDELLGVLERELEVDDAAVEVPLDRPPGAGEHRSIGRLSASTSAVKRWMPLARAIAARCSSSSVAMPLPWCASSTMNATSASSRPGHRS